MNFMAAADTVTALDFLPFVAALLGAVVGAVTGGVVRSRLDQRAEDAQMAGALRLTKMELETLNEVAGRHYDLADLQAAIAFWPSVRDTLARNLSSGQWEALVTVHYYVSRVIEDRSPEAPGTPKALLAEGVNTDLPDHSWGYSAEYRHNLMKRTAAQALEALQRYESHGRSDKWDPELKARRLPPLSDAEEGSEEP